MDDLSEGISEGFVALTQFFINERTLGETLLSVSQLACEESEADMAGITMLLDGRPRTGVFTDPTAPEIDMTQYKTGRGPCLDAFRHQRIYRIDSTDGDPALAGFRPGCSCAGG